MAPKRAQAQQAHERGQNLWLLKGFIFRAVRCIENGPQGSVLPGTAQNQLWQLRQPAPPLEFPGEQGMFADMYAQVREEEQDGTTTL